MAITDLTNLTNLANKALAGAARTAERVPWRERALAPPPAGSGLQPVRGSYGLPYVGRGLTIKSDIIGFSRAQFARYGDVSWTGFLGTEAVVVLGPDAVQEVLNNRDKAFANGPGWEYFIGPFFHRGVMLLDFGEHLQHKEIMQQVFSRERLEDYLQRIDAAIARSTAQWQDAADFPAYDRIKQLLLDIGTEVFVGTSLGEHADRVNKAFVDTVVAGLSMIRADVRGGGWHRGVAGRRLLEDYFRELLPDKRKTQTPDLFSMLCHAETSDGTRFSDDDIINHMIFVLMAAHDTSTITAAQMTYYLARDRALQDAARDEAQGLDVESVRYDDLGAMPVLDRVFRETLRINPPVGMIMRQAVEDTSIQGRFVPKGTKIVVAIVGMHRIADFWSRPDDFDPDRFAEHRREDRAHPYLWSPFGGGVHKCIGLYFGGMEVKTIMYHLLRNFSWSVPDGYEPPMVYGTGLHPGDGLPITLRRLSGSDVGRQSTAAVATR